MPVIAVYLRVSTQRQAQSQSNEQQLERLRAYARAQNWDLAPEHVFRDDGYSGASLQRPGLDRLRDAAASARLDRILITAPDRLARNYVHQVLLVEELQRHGAEVVFLDRPMSRDPHDQLLLQIRGAVAEYERTLIAERMRRGRLRRLEAGTLLPWTQPPYGYRLDPDRPRDPAGVRIDEAQAAVVRNLFVWYADEGATIMALIRRLAQLSITSPKGCPTWSPSALRGLLTNPTYTGQVFASRGRTSPARTRRSALRPVGRPGGTRRPTDHGQWIAVARVPALITQEQFDRAAERLLYNRRMARRNNRVHPYLLRGLVSCGHCRHSCTGRRLPPAYNYYFCRAKSQSRLLVPGERCPARYIPAKPLEELVWADLCEVLAHPEMIGQAMERARGGHWLPQEWQARRANLRRGRASLCQQIERLTEAYLAGIVGLGEYERRRREAEARLLALERQEQELVADGERQSETAKLVTHAEAFCRRVRDGLAAADFERKRALLELLVDRIVVTDDAVEIRYVFPTGPDGEREPFCRLRTDYLEALLAPEPGRGVRSLLRGPGGAEPDRAPGSDVRFHHCSRPRLGRRGERGPHGQALGRSRGGFSSKIHLKVDLEGLPLAFHLTEGQASDSPQFEVLLDIGPEITPRAAVGDKSYDGKRNRAAARERGICPVIPFKATARNRPRFFATALYRARARIEQLVGKLKRFKRIALRCEKTAQNYGSFVALALGFILIKSVHRA